MTITEVVNKYEALGVQFWVEGGQLRFRAPAGVLNDQRRAELRSYKEHLLTHIQDAYHSLVVADPQNRYSPFPLTDVQAAYLVGREDIYEFGGVGCHGYMELTMPCLEKDRLEKAWHAVIQRHDMLRAVVFKQGYQQVLAEVIPPPLRTQDLRGFSPDQAQAAIQKVRAELSNRQYTPEQWPLYELFLTTTDENSILHFSLDMLIADFVSANIIMAELNQLYHQPEKPLPPLEVTYRDLLLFQQSQQKQPFNRARKERDRQYWLERMENMPEAPELPVAEGEAKLQKVSFERHHFHLDQHKWASICQQAKQKKITSSGAVLAAFAEVIGLWSRRSEFCINITVLNRPELHPQINEIVGDFTEVSVLEVAPRAGSSFLERVQALQQRLWLDMEHSSLSGIEFLRELSRRRNKSVIIPVVYTSMIGIGDTGCQDGELMRGARFTYGISQTPQVWIDCQASERCGELHINWDVRGGVFPAGMIEDAFTVFEQLLQAMAAGKDIWQKQAPLTLPDHVQTTRKFVNNTAVPMPAGLLQDGFCANVKLYPDAPALISAGRQFTYQDLADHAAAVQQALVNRGCHRGDNVAVVLEKGLWQIASVLGILLAGGVYLPIDVSQPRARRDTMLKDSGTRFIVTHDELAEQAGEIPLAFITVEALTIKPHSLLQPVPVDPSQPAYIIHTSGSTGRPKGVILDHRAVLNTIQDINARYEVNSRDKILGLANLGFDLSVYDIFGLLTAGGTLILPDAKRQNDPGHWYELISQYGITIWNSVPAQMQMLLSYLQSDPALPKPSLRLALLSGDWIPAAMPQMLFAHCPGVKGVSLGGATEAAIWSIFHPLEAVPAGAKRIPYGKPLTNQRFYVLNARLQPCPDWTIGDLYIGGAGLARGYSGDPELTAERFIVHPETKERLYFTGDLGRYRPDGVIEFLGREDAQVKIRGHRIELNEIESVLQNHPSIASAVAMVNGNSPQEYRLSAFVEARRLPWMNMSLEEKKAFSEACFQAGEKSLAAVDRSLFARWIAISDRMALGDIIKTLREFGLFKDANARHRREEIQTAAGIAPKYHRLLRRWLHALSVEKLLQRDADTDMYSLLALPPDDAAVGLLQTEMEELEQKVKYGADLVRYLQKSNSRLPELLRGEVDPLDLFFPQGKLETAMAAYNDNLASRCLNSVVAQGVLNLVDQHARLHPARPLRILEVGAGVGGTTVELLPLLKGRRVEYCFTDISTFFLNEARSRFAEYPWVTYGLFDINEAYWQQGLTAASWDIIICANVLHNARHAPTVLANLKELAVPDGALVVIDATQEAYSLLTSLAFLFNGLEFEDGATGFTDLRANSDWTFFSRENWREMFSDFKLDIMCEYPTEEDPLAYAGQTIFITRFMAESVAITAAEITNYLQTQLPEYMVPGYIEVLPQIPLSSNGKVDRAALKRRGEISSAYAPGSGEAPQDDLEQRIAGIWAAALNRETIWRNEDFFAAGGDSLLVAQVVANMRESLPEAKEWEWDRLMREVLRLPTVAAIGSQLRLQTTVPAFGADQTMPGPATPLVILAEGKEPGGVMKVLFHDGTGTLTIYNNLLPALINDPGRTATIAGFTLTDEQAYLSIPLDKLIVTLGQQYADLLLRHGTGRFELIGHCMGGLIAVETARVLLEAGADVAPVTVIDSNRFPYRIDDELFMERVFGLLVGADIVKAGHTVHHKMMQKALEEIITSQNGVISTEAACSLSEPFATVAQCYRQLAAKPQAQRLAELYSTLPASKGEISEQQLNVFFNRYQILCHSFRGITAYEPLSFAGDISVICVRDRENLFFPFMDSSSAEFWQGMVLGDMRIHHVGGHHLSCMQPPHVASLSDLLTQGVS